MHCFAMLLIFFTSLKQNMHQCVKNFTFIRSYCMFILMFLYVIDLCIYFIRLVFCIVCIAYLSIGFLNFMLKLLLFMKGLCAF